MKRGRFLYMPLFFMLVLSVPAGDIFGRINDHRDLFAALSDVSVKSSRDVLVLLAKQGLSPGKNRLKGSGHVFRFWRTAVFAFFVILLLAALSRAFIFICKLFRFYTRFFFDHLVKALLIGGHGPPSYSCS